MLAEFKSIFITFPGLGLVNQRIGRLAQGFDGSGRFDQPGVQGGDGMAVNSYHLHDLLDGFVILQAGGDDRRLVSAVELEQGHVQRRTGLDEAVQQRVQAVEILDHRLTGVFEQGGPCLLEAFLVGRLHGPQQQAHSLLGGHHDGVVGRRGQMVDVQIFRNMGQRPTRGNWQRPRNGFRREALRSRVTGLVELFQRNGQAFELGRRDIGSRCRRRGLRNRFQRF